MCAFLVATERDPGDLLDELDIPDGVDASVHPAREGVGLPPELWDAAGVDHTLRPRLEAARFEVALALTDPSGDTVADVLELTELADRVGELTDGAISDLAGHRMYAPGAWRIGEPIGDLDVREHAIVHFVSEGEEPVWVHTHGLSKFGRPELEAFGVPTEDVQVVARALFEIGQYMAEGALVEPGQTVAAPGLGVLRASLGEREPEHWGDFTVLELEPVEG